MVNLWRKKTDSSLFEEGRAKKEINAVRSKGFLANIYLFKVNNRNTRKMCETCSKLTIKVTLNILHTFF